jgi:hypothetical protein
MEQDTHRVQIVPSVVMTKNSIAEPSPMATVSTKRDLNGNGKVCIDASDGDAAPEEAMVVDSERSAHSDGSPVAPIVPQPSLVTTQPAPAPPPRPPACGESKLSQLEQKRVQNMRRNAAMLEKLGLCNASLLAKICQATGEAVPVAADEPSQPKQKKRKRRSQKTVSSEFGAVPAVPARRSMRRRGGIPSDRFVAGQENAIVDHEAGQQTTKEDEVEDNDPSSFDDSSVVRYVCDSSSSSNDENGSGGGGGGNAVQDERSSEVVGVSVVVAKDNQQRNQTTDGSCTGGPCSLFDPALKTIYSMHFRTDGSLLAAAGKGGRVAVFGVARRHHQQDDDDDADDDRGMFDAEERAPLLSWKAHGGWVAAVQFLSSCSASSSSSQLLMLTAANDASLTLWDINKSRQSAIARSSALAAREVASTRLVILTLPFLTAYLSISV